MQATVLLTLSALFLGAGVLLGTAYGAGVLLILFGTAQAVEGLCAAGAELFPDNNNPGVMP